VSSGNGFPRPEADRRWTMATPVRARRMRMPAGSGPCSSPCPWASIRLEAAFRRRLPRVVITPRHPCFLLALIYAWEGRLTLPRGVVGLCHHRHGNLWVGALVVLPKVRGVPWVPRCTSTAPKPTVSAPRPSGSVGDPLLVIGRGVRCQFRHGNQLVKTIFVQSQAHGVPGMARVSNGETPWPRSFALELPNR